MLSQADNQLLTQVGRGTLMGALFREYWLPALLSSELAHPDGDPVRVLLLGERLIAFRDSLGQVGLVAEHCPHRGASLFFGRNELSGLRCVYHGWKFDVHGNCMAMPNEPGESDFRHGVKATAYPTVERGGVVWAYLGPRTMPPPLPGLEGNLLPDSDQGVWAMQQECNWLQVLEGDIDTTHAGFLHYGALRAEDQPRGTFSEYLLRDRHARFAVVDVDGGVCAGAYRPAEAGFDYWRIAHFLFPCYTLPAPGVLGSKTATIARVPMDDAHTLSFFLMSPEFRRSRVNRPDAGVGAVTPEGFPALRPSGSGWHDRFLTIANPRNEFLLDRATQRRKIGFAGFSGVDSAGLQDAAVTHSMGTVVDRSGEHLGSTDSMIIRVRRRLLEAARALAGHGTVPPGVDSAEVYSRRSGGIILKRGADWLASTAGLRRAFVDHPDLDRSVSGPLG
jgi:phthalate 4,5-dioxygenase